MAIYYVSKQRGSDSYNGTAQGTPFLTIGKAATMVVAGDKVYIGPGVYRENIVMSTAGTPILPIAYIGDPDCAFLTSDTAGIVQVTGYNISWVAQAGTVIDCNSLENQEFWNLHIDGTTTTAVLSAANCEFFRCSINAAIYGVSGAGMIRDSFISAGQIAVNGLDDYRCIMIGGGYGAAGGNHLTSIAIGGSSGYHSAVCYGCQAIGSTYGFNLCTSYNCVAYNCYNGFYGSSLDSLINSCTGIGCRYGFYGTDAGNALVLTLTSGNMNTADTGGTVSGSVGTCTAVCYNWFDIRKYLEPFLCAGATSIRATGNNVQATMYDILYRERGQNDGTVSRGAYEVCNEWLSSQLGTYTTTPPSVVITRAGQTIFYIPVEAGKTINVSVDVKTLTTDTGSPPSIKLRNSNYVDVNLDTAVMQLGDGQWSTLTVSGTVAADSLLELVLCSNDIVSPTARAIFANIQTSFTTITTNQKFGVCGISAAATSHSAATVIPSGGGGSGSVYLGNVVPISGRANWQYMQNGANYRCAVTFVPTRTGTLNRLGLSCNAKSGGYGAGDGGANSFELRPDGTGHFPGATKIGSTVANQIPGVEFDGIFYFDVTDWAVTAGTRYHLVWWIPAGTPSRFCSINTGTSDVYTWPLGGYGLNTPRVAITTNGEGSWSPWASAIASGSSAWVTSNSQNGSHSSLMWRYNDNVWDNLTVNSNPQQSGAGSSGGSPVSLYGTRKYGEYVTWPYADFVVEKINVCMARTGTPAGQLRYTIQQVSNSAILRQAYFGDSPSSWGNGLSNYGGTWGTEASLSSPLTLTNGLAYRIYFDSPNSTSGGYYSLKIDYSQTDSVSLANTPFGGTSGYAIYDTGSGWANSGNNYDAILVLKGYYA